MDFNKHILLGNCGKDPEVRFVPNTGTQVASFSVATNHVWKDKNGEKQTHTEWHRIVCFGKQAEFVEKYLKKGMKVFIEGQPRTRSYEKDGVKRFTTETVVRSISLPGGFDGKKQAEADASEQAPPENEEEAAAAATAPGSEEGFGDDDIPF